MMRSRYGVECMGGFVQFEHVKKVYHMGEVEIQALRDASGSLLTDLTAGDLLTLEDTLELLANGGAAVESGVLPGQYRSGTGFYALDEEAQAALMAFFNVEASSGQRESSSAPYPSTSVPEGQRAGDAIE